MIIVEVAVEPRDMAEDIALDPYMTRSNYAKLKEFILRIDDVVCDLQFTIALRDLLNDVIDKASE